MFTVFSISEQTPEQISVKLFQATEEPSTCDLPKNVSWPEIMIHYYSNRELRSSWKKKKNKPGWKQESTISLCGGYSVNEGFLTFGRIVCVRFVSRAHSL